MGTTKPSCSRQNHPAHVPVDPAHVLTRQNCKIIPADPDKMEENRERFGGLKDALGWFLHYFGGSRRRVNYVTGPLMADPCSQIRAREAGCDAGPRG